MLRHAHADEFSCFALKFPRIFCAKLRTNVVFIGIAHRKCATLANRSDVVEGDEEYPTSRGQVDLILPVRWECDRLAPDKVLIFVIGVEYLCLIWREGFQCGFDRIR